MSARYCKRKLGGCSDAPTMVCPDSPYGTDHGWKVWSGDSNADAYENHSGGCFGSGDC